MSLTTKQKIITSALKLFNQNGLVNVRLQHIADEAFVSVGNLAYHYPNKETILNTIYAELVKRQDEVLAEYRVVPLFDNIDRLIWNTFQLQQEYLFFYLDTLEVLRLYPAIGELHRARVVAQQMQIKGMLDFNVSRGALKAPSETSNDNALAAQIWMTMDLWLTQHFVQTNDQPNPQAYRSAVWNLFIPYFTEMGRREYQQMLEMPYDFFL